MRLWAKNFSQAVKIQDLLRRKVSLSPYLRRVRLVCGVDASYSGDSIYACASLFQFPDMVHLEDGFSKKKVEFPYLSGFLSFREGKALLSALRRLTLLPDILLVDGHGIAHPRSLGLASHLGIASGIPSIGCAKKVLLGNYDQPGRKRGSYSYIYIDGKVIGAALRTKDDVNPIFVSPGYKIDLHSALDLVLKCSKGFRIPEPLRRAHSNSKKFKILGLKGYPFPSYASTNSKVKGED